MALALRLEQIVNKNGTFVEMEGGGLNFSPKWHYIIYEQPLMSQNWVPTSPLVE